MKFVLCSLARKEQAWAHVFFSLGMLNQRRKAHGRDLRTIGLIGHPRMVVCDISIQHASLVISIMALTAFAGASNQANLRKERVKPNANRSSRKEPALYLLHWRMFLFVVQRLKAFLGE